LKKHAKEEDIFIYDAAEAMIVDSFKRYGVKKTQAFVLRVHDFDW